MDLRREIIYGHIKGKIVLDLGMGDIGHRFLHDFVKKHSKKAIGVELNKTRAENLRNMGFDVIVGNAETVTINQKFDTIIAGDLIEHLDNPGVFLENVKKHLKKDGVFISNTPNIYAINYLLRGIFLGGNVKHFCEHTMGFSEQLLRELFRRHNLKIKKVIYFNHKENTLSSYIIRFFGLISKKWNEHIYLIAQKRK